MTATLRIERVEELSESSYLMLRNTYNMLREMKGMVDRLHLSATQGGPASLDQVAALKLTTDRLFDELERYLRPECDPDSADDAARTETGMDGMLE
ncbi:hypothetical protein GMLC_16520 [Geomonas limicola]|uniref:Uncharacterized protein n=1 Tax=Geomonas limicola TaxID=2740186 RepID=A0A6V8N983_9BACT|nr:hypothetical protein [Geomonas limicola]GFO68073.1 hypothetical protein GMLC_16520 [Geomonas limicola]